MDRSFSEFRKSISPRQGRFSCLPGACSEKKFENFLLKQELYVNRFERYFTQPENAVHISCRTAFFVTGTGFPVVRGPHDNGAKAGLP